MQKITKAEARKLYDNGKDIYLNPSKMNPNGVWHKAMKVSKPYFESTIYDAPVFDQLVNIPTCCGLDLSTLVPSPN